MKSAKQQLAHLRRSVRDFENAKAGTRRTRKPQGPQYDRIEWTDQDGYKYHVLVLIEDSIGEAVNRRALYRALARSTDVLKLKD